MDEPLDALGRPIKRNDMIAYPVRARNALWLSIVRVFDIVKTTSGFVLYCHNRNGHRVKVHHYERSVIVREP